MHQILDFILHSQDYLETFIQNYGVWVYALLFAIIFCETGLVVTPFLPGDSLLFAVGTLCAQNLMKWEIILPLLILAGILGHSTNYAIGKWFGPRVFQFESNWLLNRKHLDKAHAFYQKYGGRAVILSRFVPIVRTFAPFVAGAGTMTYRKFMVYNIIGAVAWVGLFVLAGLWFGNLPFVKKQLHYVILGIIVVSVLPIVWEFAVAWLQNRKKQA